MNFVVSSIFVMCFRDDNSLVWLADYDPQTPLDTAPQMTHIIEVGI